MAQRKASMHNTETGEIRVVMRGTEEYEQLKQEGWLSKEQISHRKEYREDYQPDYIDEPEESTIDVDESDLLKDRISEMYDVIVGKIDEIPNERYFHKTKTPVDFSEDKQMLYNAIDDFYADVDDTFRFDKYIEQVLPSVESLIEIIKFDSDQNTVYYAFTQLVNLLQGGTISDSMSKLLGNLNDYNGGYNGWYERSSRFSDMF